MNRIALIAVAALALGTADGQAKTKTDSQAFLLKVNVKKGQSFQYLFNMKAEVTEKGQVNTVNLSMNFAETVTNVQSGKQSWKIKFTGGTVKGNDVPPEASREFTNSLRKVQMDVVRDSFGRVLSSKANGEEAPNNGATEIEFPRTGIKIGSKWNGSSDFRGVALNWTHRAEAFEVVNGKKALKIASTAAGSNQVGTPKPCITWIELSTGRPLLLQGQIWIKNGGQKVNLTYNGVRR